MVIEEAQDAYLKADSDVAGLAGARGYPLTVPQDAELPAWAYQRISGPREYSQEGASGFAEARVQYTCQGASYSQAKGLASAIRAALGGFRGWMGGGGGGGVRVHGCYVENELDGYGETTDIKVVRLIMLFEYEE